MSRHPALLELFLSPLKATPDQFMVTVTQSPANGEGSADSYLPFIEGGQDWRSTLLRTLELTSFKSQCFRAAEIDWMVEAELLVPDRRAFHPNLRRNIGQKLYRALIPPNSRVEEVLKGSIQYAQHNGVQLLIELKFEENAVQIARLPDYPWELIHDGSGFLLHGQVGLSRYIAFPSVPPRFPPAEQVRVLLISSGASDEAAGLKPLPKKEGAAIAKVLNDAAREQRIRFENLSKPTLNELAAYLTQHSGKDAPHLIHFDGHGLFGKRCGNSKCRAIHKGIKNDRCKECSTLLSHEAEGYLLFENECGDPDYVSASQLGTLLQQTHQSDGEQQTGGVAALVLSACQSGMAVDGNTVFQGTAQKLIQHRVPAVVAMQYSVTVEGAIAFARQFYRALGEKYSLAVAVSQGRIAMRVDENQWYRPVLYLRWRDNEGGQLFAPEAEPNSRLDNFCGLVNWINKESNGLGIRKLKPHSQNRLEEAVKQARKLQNNKAKKLDFKDIELNVLELVFDYHFRYIEISEGELGKSEQAYYSKLTELSKSGEKIRFNPTRLSSLVKVDKTKLVRLISKLEENESQRRTPRGS